MTAVDPWDVRRSPACEHTGTTHRSIVHAHYHHQRGYVPRQVQIICDDCGGCIATETPPNPQSNTREGTQG